MDQVILEGVSNPNDSVVLCLRRGGKWCPVTSAPLGQVWSSRSVAKRSSPAPGGEDSPQSSLGCLHWVVGCLTAASQGVASGVLESHRVALSARVY